jgi:peptide/nickel transport system permease protein
MWKYLIKRLLLSVPTMIGVSIIIFMMVHLAPGGPVDVMLGSQIATEEMVEQIRAEFNLDQPLYVQYFDWLVNSLQGDLGESWTVTSGTPVSELIVQRLPVTVELTIFSLLLAVTIGIPAGIISAVYQDQLADHAMRITALTGISIPNFWLGIMLIVLFAVRLQQPWAAGGWIPPSEGIVDNLLHILFPIIALGTAISALIARMMRSEMLDTLSQDYIRTARAMGISKWEVILKDAAKNAFIPVLTVIGFAIGGLMNGAVLTETVFSLPGIGTLLILAIDRRDYRVIQGIILFIAFIFVFANIFVDILYAYLDPRITSSRGDS